MGFPRTTQLPREPGRSPPPAHVDVCTRGLEGSLRDPDSHTQKTGWREVQVRPDSEGWSKSPGAVMIGTQRSRREPGRHGVQRARRFFQRGETGSAGPTVLQPSGAPCSTGLRLLSDTPPSRLGIISIGQRPTFPGTVVPTEASNRRSVCTSPPGRGVADLRRGHGPCLTRLLC